MGGQLTDLKNMANYQEGAKIKYRDNWSDYILVLCASWLPAFT
jgi:hypothetical protein